MCESVAELARARGSAAEFDGGFSAVVGAERLLPEGEARAVGGLARDAHAHGVLPEVQFVVPHVGVDGEDDALEVGDVAGGDAGPEAIDEGGVELDALELILEEGALADQRFVLGVRLDGRLGVRQEVLELVQHLASGGGSGIAAAPGRGRGMREGASERTSAPMP